VVFEHVKQYFLRVKPMAIRFHKQSRFEVPATELFDWHTRTGALERLLPPWDGTRVESCSGSVRDEGSTVALRLPAGPFELRWVARHRDLRDGESFVDEQVSGPFASWTHRHGVTADGSGSVLDDTIDYELPLAPWSRVAAPFVEALLERTFSWRHRRTREDLMAHQRAALPKLRIAVTGASGLVGRALCAFLSTGGHEVLRVQRKRTGTSGEILWDPSRGAIDAEAFERVDAVVHLAGENIASGRWSAETKRRILESRRDGTRLLAETLASRKTPPLVLVSASAIGFYGNRADETLDESSPPGDGFLADVCRAWEAAAEPARDAGIRVVHPRIGVVLSPTGGALAQMLTPFRLGAGGRLGDGRQFMSWISLDDLVAAILHLVADGSLSGPVNATAPAPVTNAELTATLASVLHRPAIVPMPAFALRLLLGEMADALLLSSARVLPTRLSQSGFVWRHPELRAALADMLGAVAT
jgi:uncharacterized protein (TIGR01777 family)